MTDHYWRDQADRAADRHGWRPSNATVCPRVVTGRRCTADRPDDPCLCQTHHHLLDHGRQWFDRDNRRLLTGEPYNLTVEELAAFAADLEPLGLHLDLIGGPGLWHETTLLLAITRERP